MQSGDAYEGAKEDHARLNSERPDIATIENVGPLLRASATSFSVRLCMM